MRATRLFLAISAASALVGAVSAGCSSSSSSPAASQDSGSGDASSDVTMEAMPEPEAAPESGPDVVESGPVACVPDASVSSIMVPDASLGDAGATAAGCMMCVAQSPECSQLVAECNENCVCISLFQNFSHCLSSPGGSLVACAATLQGLAAAGIDAGTTSCVFSCATACGYVPNGNNDGGMPTEAGGD